jgi:hypothetical protein
MAAIPLDNVKGHLDDLFAGGEPVFATHADPTPTDDVAITGGPAIDYLVFTMTASRTTHISP